MNMLLRHLTFVELAAIFERHADDVSAPHLINPEAKKRARATARKNGLWKRITETLKSDADIPVIKRSVFREYSRTGNRLPHQAAENHRSEQLELAATALWLY